jgi:hypothetical protein
VVEGRETSPPIRDARQRYSLSQGASSHTARIAMVGNRKTHGTYWRVMFGTTATHAQVGHATWNAAVRRVVGNIQHQRICDRIDRELLDTADKWSCRGRCRLRRCNVPGGVVTISRLFSYHGIQPASESAHSVTWPACPSDRALAKTYQPSVTLGPTYAGINGRLAWNPHE